MRFLLLTALLISVSACQMSNDKNQTGTVVVQNKAAAFEVLSEVDVFDVIRKDQKRPNTKDLRVVRAKSAQWSLAEVLGSEGLLLSHPELASRMLIKDPSGSVKLNPDYKTEIYLDYNFGPKEVTDPTDTTYRNLDLMSGQFNPINEGSAKITGLAVPTRGVRTESTSVQITIVIYKKGVEPADLLVIIPLK